MYVNIEEDESVAVQMGPLIDCVFLLLIFFIVVALTKKKHREILIEHPESAVTAEGDEKPERIVIHVSCAGKVKLGSASVTLEELRRALHEKALAHPLATVVIQPHKDTAMEAIVPIVDACKFAKLERVALRTFMMD